MKETFVTQIVQPVEDNIGAGRIEQIRVFIERFVKQPFEAVMLFGENHTLAFSVLFCLICSLVLFREIEEHQLSELDL